MTERKTNLMAEPGERVEADTFAGTKIGKVSTARTVWRRDGTSRNIYEVDFPDGHHGCYPEESVRKPQSGGE